MYEKDYLENLNYLELLDLAKGLSLTKKRVKKELLISMILKMDSEQTSCDDRRATFDVPPELALTTFKSKKKSKRGRKRARKEVPLSSTAVDNDEADEIFQPSEIWTNDLGESSTVADDRRGTFVVEASEVENDVKPIDRNLEDIRLDHSMQSASPRRSRRKWTKPASPFPLFDGMGEGKESNKENESTIRRETFDVESSKDIGAEGGSGTRPQTSGSSCDFSKSVAEMKKKIDTLPTLQLVSPVRVSKRPSVFERLTTPMSLKERRSICSTRSVQRGSVIGDDRAKRISLLSAIRSSRAVTDAKMKQKSGATPRKVPDFAKIHEKQFKKMTSIVDFKKRQLERAQVLLSPVCLVKTVAKADKIASAKKSLLPVLKRPAPAQVSAVSSTSQPPSLRNTSYRQQQKEAVKNKTFAAKQTSKEKIIAGLKEVRTNKRFQLLYESSRLKKTA